MVDVFISYARESHAYARRIAEAVGREGYSVWWDEELPPHLSYGDVITDKIGAAKAVIVIWSRAAAESEWVRAEADLARSQKKLIQTSIDGLMPPMPFNQIQFAPIGDWQGEPDHPGWRKVRASLAALCGGESPPRTSPTQPHSAPPGPMPAPPPSARAGTSPVLIALVGLLVLLVAGGGAWLVMRGGGAAGADPAEGDAGAGGEREADVASRTPRPATGLFTQAAVIDDPDGFTNVRSGPSTGFPVIARINQGELFTTYAQDAAWWQVRTADSRVGYMDRSRIRLIEPGQADGGTPAELSDGGAVPAGAGSEAEQPAFASDPPQVFPDSSRRLLSQAEVADLAPARLRIARNEIFARHGRPFRDPALRRHFSRYPWYRPQPGRIALNRIEQANVALLQQAESKN